MHFSYLSTLPDPDAWDFELEPEFSMRGRYSEDRRDVFAAYYEARRNRRRAEAPHHQFANCGRAPEDTISQFTLRWGTLGYCGVLIPQPGDKGPAVPTWLAGYAAPAFWQPGWGNFRMPVDAWLSSQDRFRSLLRLSHGTTGKDRKEFAHAFNQPNPSLLSGFREIYPRVDVEWDGKKYSFKPVIAVQSLWESLCLMLLLDVSRNEQILQCKDPECAKFFTATQPNQKYCCAECTFRFNRRKWARAHLKEWRAAKRKARLNSQA